MIPMREEKEGKEHEKSSRGSGGREHSGEKRHTREETEYSQEGRRSPVRKRQDEVAEETVDTADIHGEDDVYGGGSEEDSYAED